MVNLSTCPTEPSDQQMNTQRRYVLAVVKDSGKRMLSSQLQELMDLISHH